MTAVIITAAIILLIFFLLASFVKADLEYDGVFKFKIKYLCFTLVKRPLSPKELKKKKRRQEKKKRKKEKKELKEKAARDKLSAKKRQISQNKDGNTQNAKAETKAETEKKTDGGGDGKDKSDKTDKSDKPDAGRGAKKKKLGKSKVTPELIFGIFGKAKPHIKRIFKKIRITDVYVDITVGGENAAKTAVSYGIHCAAVHGLTAFLKNTFSFKSERISVKADFDLEKTDYYGKARIKLRLSTLLHSGVWGAIAVMGELKNVSELTEENEKTRQKAA